MEWLWKSKRMIFSSIIPKTAVTFQSPPVTPRGTKLTAMIPAEARRRRRHGSFDEPGSPKVSCIGQVKIKGKKSRLIRMTKSKAKPKRVLAPSPEEKQAPVPVPRRRSDVADLNKAVEERSAPSLKQMRFASGRGVLSGFDWRVHGTAAVAPDI